MEKIAFVTNFCPHYRIKTFEALADNLNIDYYFFSAGKEWYWQQQHGTQKGKFHYEYLPSFSLGQTSITPTLPTRLWQGNYNVYIKCINGKFALPITYLIARSRRKPFILWTGIWTRIHTPIHRLIFPLTRYIYQHADANVVYGEHVRQYLVSEGVDDNRIFVAPHAVDNALYQRKVNDSEKDALRIQLNIQPLNKVILFLGRLELVKGLHYLLQAYASLQRPDTILVLAGTGTEQAALAQLAKDLNISNQIRWAGYVPADQTTKFYSLAWVTILPSITIPTGKELWGLVVNEAFNQGSPVIVTNAVGAAAGGLVKDGINGFIVPERDSSALTQALQLILDAPPLRHKLSYNARQIINTWNNEQMVRGFHQAIEYVIKKS